MTDTKKPSRIAGETGSPFAHRATPAPFPVKPPAPPPPPRRSFRAAWSLAALAVAAVAVFLIAFGGDDGSAVVAPAPVSPDAAYRRAEKDGKEAEALARRVGAAVAFPELFARAMAGRGEAGTAAKAGDFGAAAFAESSSAAKFAEAAARTIRDSLARRLAEVEPKDFREYRSELWRAFDAKLAGAETALREGRALPAARAFDEASSALPAGLAAVRETLLKLAVAAEDSRDGLAVARTLRFKLAKLAPDDAENLDWLMRRGRSPGEVVRDPLGIPFAYAPPGSYEQGSPDAEAGRKADETRRRVTISRGFFLAVTEVTQAQWDAVMGEGSAASRLAREPAAFRGADMPVVNVTWTEAREFCRKLSERTGLRHRLPTEAEWEYACRAGSAGPYASGKPFLGRADAVLDDGSAGAPAAPGPVASAGVANAWGLHDMHGNVWEWCADWYASRPADAATNPAGPSDAESARTDSPVKSVRGGSWNDPARAARSANRWSYPPSVGVNYIGFRPLLEFSVAIP